LSGQVYTLSFYIQSTATAITLLFENSTATFGAPHVVVINPSNGTAGALTGFTSVSITPYGSGYVYSLTTAPAGGLLLVNAEWRIPNNGEVINLGRPQFEAGAFATSYIPTVASTVTRAADQAVIAAPMFAPWYNQSEGTFVVEADSVNLGTVGRTVLSLAPGGVSPTYFHSFATSGNFDGTTLVRSANVATNNIPAKIGGSYGPGGLASCLNGQAVATGVYSGGFSARTSMPLGEGLGNLNGHIRSINYYPLRLTNAQLQGLTT
jgi:hypothetical protein